MEENKNLFIRDVFFNILSVGDWADHRHMKTCVDMLVGLILSKTIHLTQWIPFALGRSLIAQSVQRRFSRWLDNSSINAQELYRPIIREAISDWGNSVIYLAFDTSMLWNQYCMIRVSIVYRGRAIPLAWEVICHKSSTVAFSRYWTVLEQARKTLEGLNKRVVLLADRGFMDLNLMRLCRRFNWRFRIRAKAGLLVHRPGRAPCPIEQLCPILPGNALFLHNVYITGEKYGPVSLAVAYEKASGEKWYIISDEPTSCNTFEEYGLRFDIEENFLDDKSNGFQLESSGIRTAAGLNRLCFVMSVATLYLVAQGTEVVAQNKRRLIDPHWSRGHSYLRIGWDWVRRAVYQGGELLRSIRLVGGSDPEPARASRKQAEKRAQRFSFVECNTLIFDG